ncbi:M23 family metallopeptidase [Paraburkholderia sp. MMS20-SJTN17]|uniref:M23 family metallopeptidase n=1 Tax=Paraburkholderia translucens TaxID=2886945 RepID=A0ABS8KDF8_9BURK|nr:M23 family metallopeptidase [Paraburkholderia sp. MMS20-SJTN17]MCC8402798.1 M23 family metallopeptidase [Paraburkholderia sp. MMS20-SJTN17]
MMRLPYLRHACSSAHAISSKVGCLANCRFTSSARVVLLCGTVALVGTSDWVVKTDIASRLIKSSATLSSPDIELTVPAVDGSVSEARDSQLSDATSFVMPQANSGSYAGRIEGTLRDTLVRANVPVDAQEQIARIFAPRLDLAAPARKGDTYQVLYGSEGTTTQRMRLTAVELRSGGEVYQAVWFVAPGHTNGDYYSFGGQRLSATPFTMPLDHARVSSPFGYRTHPVKGKYHMHTGVDLAASKGTPVVAAASGTVRFVGFKQGYGNIVVLSHPRGYTTHYAHLSSFARNLRVGAAVTERQSIGAVGSTGTATGPHLHFEVRERDRPVDPLKLTGRTGASPLTSSQRIAFDSVTGPLREKLAALPVDTPTVRMASNAEVTPNPRADRQGALV